MKKKITQFRWLATMLLLVAAMAMPKMAWAEVTTSQPKNGDGSAMSPYEITTAAELAWFRDWVNAGNPTACARLEADIDMSSVCHAANESKSVAELSWEPISDWSKVSASGKFWYGTFDGNNKTISNLYINTTAQRSGLFGYITNKDASERGSVKNIKFENVSVTSSAYGLGVLAGQAINTDISGITVNSGTVNGTEYCGGIVGYLGGSSLSGCINKIDIVGGSSDDNTNIGGIVGSAEGSCSITNCANYGDVKGNRMVGGIAGSADETTIENVFSSGDVTCIVTISSVTCTGLVVGNITQNVTISGNVIYNSEANLSYGTTQQAAKAFGYIYSSSAVTESDATGMTKKQLATGKAAYLLNGSSPNGVWGQQIGVDIYPVLDSNKKVYGGYKDCLEITYSNNQEELSENPVHHYDNGFCKDCHVYQPATLNANGKYEIGNAGQLYWFAALVNGDARVCDYNETDNPTGTKQNRAASAVLTADITVDNKRIWTPIGWDESGDCYEGTFDGQYHTIKGLYYEGSASQGIGLFSQLERGTIQNVGVVDFSFSSTNTEYRVAGICASNFSGTIKNCFCIGEIHSSRAGGVCAYNEGNLSNCYFSGKIVDETNAGNVGGVCYYNTVSISNCYHNIDLFPGKAIESDWGYLAGDALGKTTAEFASGEVAYLLQGNQSEAVWGQTIGSEPYPVFGGAKVYEGYEACIKQYSNSKLSTTPTSHDYSENGICNTCHAYKPATLTTDKYDIDNDGTNDNVYEISNVGQLYWFAALVNGDTGFEGVTEADGSANARLMNDIIVNANVLNGQGELNAGTSYTVWTPIGNSSSDFRGIFDGAGHSVSGLYINDTETGFVGFFAYSRGTIKNVGVVDSYIKGNEHVAGVCAYNMYGTISNCYNEGTVCGGGNNVGGVCSESYGGTVTNCYNAGAVSGTDNYVGGLCGNNYYGTITYSFNRGQVSGVSNVGGICGLDSEGNIKNCYYLSGTANSGIGFENDGVKTESKTEEQFADGEVCYMLNGYRSAGTAENPLIWYQNLSAEGGDAYPVYTRTETNTVYGGYDHGGTTLYCDNDSKIPTAHPHAHGYDPTAEDEASGNHDKSYEAKFVWTDNAEKTSASVTARFTCQVCNQESTPVVTAVPDSEHSNATATCTKDAQNTYTTSYSFTGATFTDTYKQVITPALGHDLTKIEFFESSKIYSNACRRTGCGHRGYYGQSDGTMPAVYRDNNTGYVVEKADITDATAYTSKARFTVDTLNYTRKFSDNKWMAVYVPFVIDCDILDDEYEMAVINNFHEYEQEDGSYKVVLEVKRVTRGGTIPALTPCLIRMKTAPEAETSKTLTFTNVAFEPAAQKYIDCASMTSYYKFLGTLESKDGFNEATDYVLSNGILYRGGINTHLLPQRWYLSTSLISNGSIASNAKVRSISIGVIGDGDTTGIEEIYVNTESCADADSNSAIYDLQGRKLSREPQKGIYIKNGVKLVK
ncbi:GLUG motif-containing protein [Prevotella sp. P2-180]|uniref:GLUG motif-containing protein n=1 Tax=Prevotella sp. P2-180 TaxID=2024224 RepID=UPI000B96015A|nr:GLUG motif-containing protein [Prevotella sp. P2-180]OYP64809.1 hypothetical protein CIK98_09135 [Prevotella sp. P2-180]